MTTLIGLILFGSGLAALLISRLIGGRHRHFQQEISELRACYRCQECQRPVDTRSTLRHIRQSLLCPEHYHARFGTLPPPPPPSPRRYRRAEYLTRHHLPLLLPPRSRF